eukprot:gnl/Dysnectes_brevis/2923_a3583_968.p1 GENE.gnl/Dysnectes_brevis/2923_a3583_968~~gnl/Dysnectes_brevis/2923_a3583_968.p1  ORF type:complete len:418 (+),score=99.58 gnl/Dysnectes_brevis/2923_a3583_968:43-1296(+)
MFTKLHFCETHEETRDSGKVTHDKTIQRNPTNFELPKVLSPHPVPITPVSAQYLQFVHPYSQHMSLPLTPLLERCLTKHGSHTLCKELDEAAKTDQTAFINQLFSEVLPHSLPFSQHLFANYVLQKLVEVCTDEQATQLASYIGPASGDLAFHRAGCRVVLRLLSRQQPAAGLSRGVWLALQHRAIPAMCDRYATHVMQELMRQGADLPTLVRLVSPPATLVALACRCHSCYALQKLLELGNEEQLAPLLPPLLSLAPVLAPHRYGNYVIQSALRAPALHQAAFNRCFELLLPSLALLARKRHSSNVAECLLGRADDAQLSQAMQALLCGPDAAGLVGDPLATYVLKKVVLLCPQAMKPGLLAMMRGLISQSSGKAAVQVQSFCRRSSQQLDGRDFDLVSPIAKKEFKVLLEGCLIE